MNLHHDTREPEEIERDLDRARAQVSATLDAIQQRITPGQLMDQAFDYLRHSAPADFGANLGHTVRHNPVPVTLIGVGIAWLMAQGRHGTVTARAAAPLADPEEGWDATYGRPADARADEAEGRWRHAADAAGAMGHKLKDGAAQARERARHTRERMADGMHRARGAVSGVIDEQPLVLGAIGLALGALLGAALPPTRREDEWLGEPRDDLLDRARHAARDKADAVAQAVRQDAQRSDEERRRAAEERRGDYPARAVGEEAELRGRMDGLM